MFDVETAGAVTSSSKVCLPPDVGSPREARRVTRDVLESWGLSDEELLHDAQMAVSELVTNAVVHGRTAISVEFDRQGEDLVLAVCDGSPAVPELREAGVFSGRGRGIAIVAAISEDWGVEKTRRDGKRVWARLRCRS